MKKLMIIGLATGLLAISSCSTVPLTGRSRLSLIDDFSVATTSSYWICSIIK